MTKYPKPLDAAFVRHLSVQFDLFHRGPDHKATKKELAEDLRANTRTVELAIYELRQSGIPIASDGEGYWLATTPRQLDHPIASLKHRLAAIQMTLNALAHARENMIHEIDHEPNGQRRLFAGVGARDEGHEGGD